MSLVERHSEIHEPAAKLRSWALGEGSLGIIVIISQDGDGQRAKLFGIRDVGDVGQRVIQGSLDEGIPSPIQQFRTRSWDDDGFFLPIIFLDDADSSTITMTLDLVFPHSIDKLR